MNITKVLYRICAMLLTMLTCVASLAQDKNETTRLAATNQNHQLLAGITGSWTFTGKHTFAGSNHRPIEFVGSMVRKAFWDDRYFTSEVTGQDIPMPWSNGKPVTLHEMMTEGYDNVKGKFVSSYINNEFETGIILLEGNYNGGTKIITYDGETLSPPGGNLPAGTMRKFHVLLKFIDDNHYTLEWHESVGERSFSILC
ncbi:MAG: DUF1579 family protein [Mucilaginibacter sp.]